MKIFPLHLIPASPNVNFMRLRWVSIAIAVLLAVAALAAIGFKGFNYALDFTGGTLVEMHFASPANVDHVREPLVTAGYDGAQAQTTGRGRPQTLVLPTDSGRGGAMTRHH